MPEGHAITASSHHATGDGRHVAEHICSCGEAIKGGPAPTPEMAEVAAGEQWETHANAG